MTETTVSITSMLLISFLNFHLLLISLLLQAWKGILGKVQNISEMHFYVLQLLLTPIPFQTNSNTASREAWLGMQIL